MKILVLNNAVPFIRGGAEELADHLVRRLNEKPGVRAELLRIPFSWQPAERLIDEILIHRRFRLTNVDRVIGLKFPAYLIPHPHKRLWLLHQFRQAYDLYQAGQGLSHIDHTDHGQAIVKAVRTADDECFASCRDIHVISPVIQKRLQSFNGFSSSVLYHPPNDPELFVGGEYGNYLFAGGRVGPGKRQHLLIEAMRFVKAPINLLVAGPPDSDDYAQKLQSLVATHGLEDRVKLDLALHPRTKIAELVNGAMACAYLPYDEDSLSYVAMEAFMAGKAIITTTDAGGLIEIVHDGVTGFVAAPDVEQIAAKMDAIASAPLARQMGGAARDLLQSKNISWNTVIDVLLS